MITSLKLLIKKIRRVRPDITVSSDFIVGFPGEEEEDHQATLDLVDEIGFDQSYSFIYSRRPGTPAAYLADEIDLATKKALFDADFKRVCLEAENPYWIGDAGPKIANILSTTNLNSKLLRKKMTLSGVERDGWFR